MGLFDKIKKVVQDSGVLDSIKGSSPVKEQPAPAAPVAPVAPAIEYSVAVDFELEETEGGYMIAKFVGFEEENMEIPSSLDGKTIVGIADEAFCELSTLKNLKIAEGIKFIGNKTFYNCPELESVVFPTTLEELGNNCFAENKYLKEVKLPSLKKCGTGCFQSCEELTTVVLPEDMEIIPDNMFCRCDKLLNITFPKNVSVIGHRAFKNCAVILESLPDTLTVIGDEGLSGCFQDEDGYHDAVDEMRLPSGLTSIGAEGLSGLNCLKLIVPASVKSIGKEAFSYLGCVDGEVEVIFEDGCEAELPVGLFYNSSLATDSSITSITIPSSITVINDIFYGIDKAGSKVYYEVKDQNGQNLYDAFGKKIVDYTYKDASYDAPPENLTIYCDPGSAAMKFAREKGINCAKKQ